jgi:hypothetical protein
LKAVVAEKELAQAKILLFLNKLDKLENPEPQKILEEMDIKDFLQRIQIQPGSLKKNEGVKEGIEWLAKNMVSI